jgi:twitching motility protein PilJ
MKINWKLLLNQWKVLLEVKPSGSQTINQRLAMLFAVLVGGFVLVATAYLGVVAFNSVADRENERVNEFGFAVDRIEVGMLQARREEKDFLSQRKEDYLRAHEQTMGRVYKDIDKVESLAPDAESRGLLGEVRSYVKTYHGTFQGVAEALRRAGFDDTSGLNGAMRAAAQETEELLDKNRKTDLIASLLQMRRIEKEFAQRSDPKFVELMAGEQKRFAGLLARSDLPAAAKTAAAEKIKVYHGAFLGLAASYREIGEETRAFNDVVRKVDPILAALTAKKDTALSENRSTQSTTTQIITLLFIGVLIAITAVVSAVVFKTRRSITQPLERLTGTLAAITAGERDARVKLTTGDEMQQLGDALDRMMDERGKFMQTEAENEKLNSSVISILRSVSQLGKGDLTVRVPVNEDITGALGDAINNMSESIGKTLGKVHRSSDQVVNTSRQTRDLTTQSRDTVLSTAGGMNEIRATIQETAKRIKRLGERSQEIGGIVKLIDTIAERTNMLALNANMQAAQAGEAGRGFMVVAAEVQRLAESAKEATHQISKLVNNIQVETGDTMAAMDEAIEEVVEGSELAEEAAKLIKRNEEAVAQLDALGRDLLDAVLAFKLPTEFAARADGDSRIKAVA